jgi:hypothetical protein
MADEKKIYPYFTWIITICCHNQCSKTIRGKVTDAADGSAIPGASVLVKGTSTGATTQNDGSYTINVPTSGTTLVFTYLGYQTQEVSIGSKTEVNAALVSTSQTLEDVVITALGIKRSEKSVGYATQQLKGDNLTLTKEQNVIGSLAGKIAGVQVVGSSGANMGGTQKIKIRSVNSVNGSGQALIVVDGTPIAQSNFGGTENGVDYGNVSQDINPEDIETINVLKGPAASALYGIRGQYVGLDYGLPGSTTVTIANFSLLGSNLRLQNSPIPLVTYAQQLFAMAEAAKLGWITGSDATAQTHYNNAVTESIRQWTGSTATAAAYLAQPNVTYDAVNALMKIGNQRWVHLFLHGYEGWAEWRRTGFPNFLAPPPANNGALIPRREAYGTQERSINSANYTAAVAGFPYGGADDLNARVWWDKP